MRAEQQGCRMQSGEIPAQRSGAHQHSPQSEGVSAPQLVGRESGKRSGAAERARDFFLPLCFLVCEERGFRAPPKRSPETGARSGYQHGPQRRA